MVSFSVSVLSQCGYIMFWLMWSILFEELMYCVLYINGGAEFVAGGGVSDIMEC